MHTVFGRLVEVWAAGWGGHGRHGSGWILGTSGVLTCRHVVDDFLAEPPAGAQPGMSKPLIQIRQAGHSGTPDWVDATLAWSHPSRDVVLLHVTPQLGQHWPATLGRSPRLAATGEQPLQGTAVGFPDAEKKPGRQRDTEQAPGRILPGGGVRDPDGLVKFDVDSTVSDSQELWKGFSGATVRDQHDRIVALVVKAHPGREQRRLSVLPSSQFALDPGFVAAAKTVGFDPTLEDHHAPLWASTVTPETLTPAGAPPLVDEVKDLAVFGVHLPAVSSDLITSLGYLPRDPDGDLDEALAEATTVGGRIVLVIGDSAAGKSRSAAQAVQHNEILRQRHLIVPRNDAGLARLLDSLAPMDDHVLWLDDLDKYLSRGLDVADIGRVLAEHPSTVCVATMRKDKFRALQGKLDDPAWEFLKNETTTIRVDVKAALSQTEQEDLEALTDDPALLHAVHEGIGLGEWMVAGPELMEKLAEAEPRESALAHTIIGWYRTGLQQPLPADDARTLWERILPEPQRTKMRHLTAKARDAAFQRAVDWVCEPVLDREGFEQSLAEETADGLAAHDYVVDRIARDPERPPVPNSLWELALKVASDIPASSGHWPTWEAGMAAFKEGMFEHALTAMRTLAANGKRTGLVLVNTGAILTNLGRPEEAIAVYDEVLDRFGTDPDPLPRTRVAWALRNKGLVLGSLGRQSQAIAVFDDLIARYGTDPDPHLREPVATALFNQGRALADLGKTDKAIASYDDVVTRYGTDSDPDLRVDVAGALVFKGIALKMSGRAAEAVAAFDEVVTRFGTDPDPALRKKVATALVFKGIFPDWLDRPHESVAAFDEVVTRYGTDPDPELREQVAQAQVNKGIALDCLDRPHEAVAAYDEVATRYGTDPDPDLRKKVATALVKKGRALGRVDRPQEAVAAYDEVVTRYGTDPDPELRKEVATALVKKGEALGRVDRREALAAFDDVVTRYGTDPDPELREQVAQAQVNKGISLYWLDRRQEAFAAFDEVVTRYGTDPALHERVAQALVYKGIDLDQLHRPQQAVAAYDEVVNRYGTDPDPALREQVAHAQVNRGMALVRAGRREEAVAAYDKVVSRYDTDPALREQVARAQELRKLLGVLEAHPGDS